MAFNMDKMHAFDPQKFTLSVIDKSKVTIAAG